MLSTSIQHERIESIAGAHQHVLMSIERVGFGRVGYYAAQVSVPQWLSVRGIVGHNIARDVAREEQLAGGGHHSAAESSAQGGINVLPDGLAGFIVDGRDVALRGAERQFFFSA